jgi:hypothetical protein
LTLVRFQDYRGIVGDKGRGEGLHFRFNVHLAPPGVKLVQDGVGNLLCRPPRVLVPWLPVRVARRSGERTLSETEEERAPGAEGSSILEVGAETVLVFLPPFPV